MSDKVRLDIQLSNFLSSYLNCTLNYNMVIVVYIKKILYPLLVPPKLHSPVYEMANLWSYSMFSSKVPCYPLLELQIVVFKLIWNFECYGSKLSFMRPPYFENTGTSLTGGSQMGNSQLSGSPSSKLHTIIQLKEVRVYGHKWA